MMIALPLTASSQEPILSYDAKHHCAVIVLSTHMTAFDEHKRTLMLKTPKGTVRVELYKQDFQHYPKSETGEDYEPLSVWAPAHLKLRFVVKKNPNTIIQPSHLIVDKRDVGLPDQWRNGKRRSFAFVLDGGDHWINLFTPEGE